jgi:molybdenum-dependent DNA-binding transcriptional regulator ModE
MEKLLMSSKERRRLGVLERVKDKEMSLSKAAEVMGISYRQARRIWKRYLQGGDAGLVHRSRGREGNRRKASQEREKILSRYKECYPDFGPTLACEHLEREGFKIDHETLRRWLLQEGEWTLRRKRQKHRQWRERRECFGEMVQMDGSHHDWFEGRRERAVLMVMIDDATNRTWARFSEEETTRACYDLLEQWIKRYGVPSSLYVDRDSIYRCERLPSVAEQITGKEPRTNFGRAMDQLGVELILANSPQAKGRVERRNGLFQDRLVKEMRLKGISDLKGANEFLSRTFLPAINRRFTVEARNETDAHQRLQVELNEVMSWEEERTVGNDWTVVWKNRWFQIERQHEHLSLARKKVMLRELRNGQVHLIYGGKRLRLQKLPGKLERKKAEPKRIGRTKLVKPAAWHPWKLDHVAAGKEYFKKKRAEGALVRRTVRHAAAGCVGPSLRSACTTPAAA